MSPMERETLNPCEKLQRFGKIPWKLSIHTALVFATTLMVYIWTTNDGLHIRNSHAHFHRALLGVSGSLPADRFVEIPTAEDLKTQIDAAVTGYWNVGESRLANYSLCKDPLVLEATYYEPDLVVAVSLEKYNWQDNEAYRRITTSLTPNVKSLAVRGVVHDRFEGRFFRQCLRWNLGVLFDNGGTGLLIGSIQHDLAECSSDGSTNGLVPVVVMALALASMILCAKAEYSRKRRDMVEFSQRRTSGWFMTNMAANTVQILGGFSCLRLTHRMDVETRFLLIGFAAIGAWTCILQYLRYFHIYYLLIRTLTRAVPKCVRFVTGVFPILMGYALLGTCLFNQSAMFSSIGASIATLFSLLNGDIIRDTFSDICNLRPGLGEAYLYSFLCLFIYVVLHLFISIVEEAYFSAKHQESPQEVAVQMTVTTADLEETESPGLAKFVSQNLLRELEMLKSMGELNRHVRTEISSILNS
jgi:hypothetical protein